MKQLNKYWNNATSPLSLKYSTNIIWKNADNLSSAQCSTVVKHETQFIIFSAVKQEKSFFLLLFYMNVNQKPERL